MTDNINSAHGKEQNIKMNLLKWLNEGKDPYSIIYEFIVVFSNRRLVYITF